MKLKVSIGYLGHTGTEKGLGVFASRDISQGEVVEICPVIHLSGQRNEVSPPLKDYVFNWKALGGRGEQALCLGYGGMYNHANPANLIYSIENSRAMKFVAARAIRADEELTVNYNDTKGGIESTKDVWFKGKGIKPLP